MKSLHDYMFEYTSPLPLLYHSGVWFAWVVLVNFPSSVTMVYEEKNEAENEL